MKNGDLLTGLSLLGLGIFIIHQALQLDYINEYGPGPGFLPLWLGIGFLALASSLVVMTLLRFVSHTAEEGSWSKRGRALATWGGLMVATVLLNRMGFILSFAILTLFLVFVMDRRPLLAALMVAVGSAFGFYLIFSVALGLSLPVSPWGF
ncbi:MAG: tripartite tricarboxylate transporter TctB family protein [Deltaproteobacteria bacterium]|nr:tripartite tricarboxylate transporter TctB family protein [Deltaproteobacteria bacterium]